MVRPLVFTPEDRTRIVSYICDEIATKRRSLASICEEPDMPSYSLVAKWRRENEEVREAIARAREDALEAMIEEIVEISDERNGDVYIGTDAKGNQVAKVDGDVIQRAKLRVYARERAAALLAPRLFGNKLDVTSGGEKLPAPQATISDRIDAILALAIHRRMGTALPGPEPIDITPEPELDDLMR